MYSSVLFPTDLSEYARVSVRCLPHFRRAGAERSELLHVLNPMDFVHWGGTDSERFQAVREQAAERLSEEVNRLAVEGMAVSSRVEVGAPYETIVEIAEREDFSLIVMGAHGHGFLPHRLLGSVTERVLRHATRPVLVLKARLIREVGPHICDFVCGQLFRRILFPTDFSEQSRTAFAHLRAMRSAGLEEAVLLHVQDTRRLLPHLASRIEEFNRTDRVRLEEMAGELKFLGVEVKPLVSQGVPFLEINRLAEAEDVDLIVMGSHGRSAVAEVLLGSVTQEVVRKHARPVLVIPRSKHND